MYVELVAAFLGISLLFYCLLAGADFGGGILELFLAKENPEQQRELIGHAMGPVWEANHMWLILAVVILFNGFPKAYEAMSIRFHIPLTLMLIGIILRGCAFTFRQYDVGAGRSHRVYSVTFMISSLVTSWAIGVIAGAMYHARTTGVSETYFDFYLRSWIGYFPFATGLLTCVLFAFLAAVYLTGEAHLESMRKVFAYRAFALNIGLIFAGALVFGAAELDGIPLFRDFASEPFSLLCMVAATLLLVPLWLGLRNQHVLLTRLSAGAQGGLILLGWFRLKYPVFLDLPEGPLTIANASAPEETMRYLLWALLVGSSLIFPALYFLFRMFKIGKAPGAS
jgi:cytochrome d ubiquinol oxidase subunit II